MSLSPGLGARSLMHLLGVQEEDASLLGVPWSPEDSELRHSPSTRNRSLGSVASPTQPPAGEGETAHNERASSRAAGRVCRGEAQRGVRSLRPGPLPAFSGSQSPGHQQPSTVGEGPARVPSPSDLGLCPGRQLSTPRGRSGGEDGGEAPRVAETCASPTHTSSASSLDAQPAVSGRGLGRSQRVAQRAE